MLIANCINPECDGAITSMYETGQEPVGAFEKVLCNDCGTVQYLECITIAGRVLSEAEFAALNPVRLEG